MNKRLKNRCIYFMEQNHRGVWVVYGVFGIQQYYYYTQKQAQELYMHEAENILLSPNPMELECRNKPMCGLLHKLKMEK
ncbi:MAG: hypothetical protein ACLUIO_19475 [Neglectibacter timonensis]